MQKNLFFQPLATFVRRYWLALLIMLICGIFQLVGLKPVLQFDRIAIEQGEFWRALSANFVHLGAGHYWMNMGALGLMWLMFYQRLCWREWTYVILMSSFFVFLGVWFFEPNLIYYVGLSGTLHGIMCAGVMREWSHDRYFAAVVGAMTCAKLCYEQFYGALPGSENSAGGRVIVDAHLFGALGGIVGVLSLVPFHSDSKIKY